MIFEKLLSIVILFSCIIPNNADITVTMFEELAAHVKSLEQKLNTVEEKLETVQTELAEQKRINQIQEDEISTHKNLIDSLGTLNTELTLKIDKMELLRETSQSQKAYNEVPSENLSDKYVVQKDDLSDEREKKIRIVRQERERIAFSAFLNRDLSNLGPSHTIQYGATRLNEGNAFNAQTGIFTVPIDGVYLFSFACEDWHNHRIYADILVDGTRASLVLEGPAGVSHAMGTNVVILRLTKGQSVWVAIDAGGRDEILQNSATTFSGVFLYY